MSVKIFEKFTPRANPADANYPYGSIKNESVPGAKDGTPLDAVWGNDMVGFTDALLADGEVTPNGLADTVLNSQRLTATKKIIDIRAFAKSVNTQYNNVIRDTDTVSAIPEFIYSDSQEIGYSVPAAAIGKIISSVVVSTLNTADLSSYQLESINKSDLKMTLAEAVASTDILVGDSIRITDRSDGVFDVVLASGVTPNTYNIIQCVGNSDFALVLRGQLTTANCGANIDGITDDSVLIEAISALGPIILSAGTSLISTSISITDNCKFETGAALAINTGIIVTFDKAPDIKAFDQIFYGLGTANGVKTARPEWWGASSSADSETAIMAAYKSATSTISGAVLELRDYQIGATVEFEVSTDTPVTFTTYGTNIRGSRFTCSAGFTGSVAFLIKPDIVNNILSFEFEGPGMMISNNAAGDALVGVQIGIPDYSVSGLTRNKIKGLATEGFSVAGIDILNSRLLTFEGCSVWSAGKPLINGFRIRTAGTSTGLFCGDMDFNECQSEPKGVGTAISIDCTTDTGNIKGVRFSGHALYKSENGSQLSMLTSNTSEIGDIWFSGGCQFDGFSNSYISIHADGAGSVIGDIHFDHVYFRGANLASSIYIRGTNSGIVQGVFFDSPWVANSDEVFNINSVDGFSISDGIFHDISSIGSVINISQCTGFSISNNKATRSGAANFATFIAVSGASDYYTVTNNNSNGIATTALISDSGTGTNKTITGNI